MPSLSDSLQWPRFFDKSITDPQGLGNFSEIGKNRLFRIIMFIIINFCFYQSACTALCEALYPACTIVMVLDKECFFGYTCLIYFMSSFDYLCIMVMYTMYIDNYTYIFVLLTCYIIFLKFHHRANSCSQCRNHPPEGST
jgi:hypothetical protein